MTSCSGCSLRRGVSYFAVRPWEIRLITLWLSSRCVIWVGVVTAMFCIILFMIRMVASTPYASLLNELGLAPGAIPFPLTNRLPSVVAMTNPKVPLVVVAEPSLHDSIFPLMICSWTSWMVVSIWHVLSRSSSHGCSLGRIPGMLFLGSEADRRGMWKFFIVLRVPLIGKENDGYPCACCMWSEGWMSNMPGAIRWCSRYVGPLWWENN